jgi:serine/threonine-protein kinase
MVGYSIEHVIGRGGMGVIYCARELELDRSAALKVVAPELAADPGFRARFLREAQIAASIEHPHVVPILPVGGQDGTLFIAMRPIQGQDLADVIRAEGSLAPERAARIVDQVADALDAAHEKASCIAMSAGKHPRREPPPR